MREMEQLPAFVDRLTSSRSASKSRPSPSRLGHAQGGSFQTACEETVGMEAMATILHADLDAFYASVEQLLDPSLRGGPIAVGGEVVLAASYEAKSFGVFSGMSGRRARELCPHLTFVSGHFKEYQRLGDAAIAVLGDFTPLVERISIDEAFADVAGCIHLFGPPSLQQSPRTGQLFWPA